jgi:hypothetical protein
VTGTATSTSTPNSEPAKPPTETLSKASTEKPRNGRAAKGTTAISSEAARTSRQSPRRCGWRSAKRPPNQYPAERATRTTPIVFAQTIVEAPK